MNKDMMINQLAYITGTSRKQVLDTLKMMSSIPEVKKAAAAQRHDKKGRKATAKGSR